MGMDASSLQAPLLCQSSPSWLDLHLGKSRRGSQGTLDTTKLLPVQAGQSKKLPSISAKVQPGADLPPPHSEDKSSPTDG